MTLSYDCCSSPFFFTGRLDYLHTPKAGVTLGDLQMLQKRLVVFRFTVPVENPDTAFLQRGIVDVCASRLQTCSCKSKMRIWRMFKSPRPIFNVGRRLKCCSFTFWTDSHQKGILPQVTSSNWNSLLSCNSINTPSTLTMGSQGFSLWLALVGAMQVKMAVRGFQGLRLPRFNV